MPTREPTPFEQVFPARDLFRGAGLRGLLLSALGSCCLCLLLVVLVYLADLLITQGEVTIAAGDVEAHTRLFELLTGQPHDPDRDLSQALPHAGYEVARTPF
ncbi:MAG: hypothetical protein EHM42_15015, partial [Planctomycetaceae bacterium]